MDYKEMFNIYEQLIELASDYMKFDRMSLFFNDTRAKKAECYDKFKELENQLKIDKEFANLNDTLRFEAIGDKYVNYNYN